MKFYVVLNDGRKFGPADINTLNQWIKEGRLNRDTMVENAETGQRGHARDVQGLTFEPATPDLAGGDPVLKSGEPDQKQQSRPVDIPGQPKPYIAGEPQQRPQQPQQPQQPVQQPSNPYASPPQPASVQGRGYNPHIDDGSQRLINNAWILIAVSFVLCGCFLVSPFAIYNANRAKNMGNANAQTPLVVATVLLIIELLGWGIYFAIVIIATVSAASSAPTV